MSVPTVCRVCLVSNLNLYGVRNDLQTAYVRITREKYNKVGYPLSMCYICLSALQKCHRFMETARDTNRMLKQWHNKKNEVSVARPLSIYAVSKAEFLSIEHEDALDHDIKAEVDPEPDNCDTINIYDKLDVEKTDEQTSTRLFIDSLCFKEELIDDDQTHILPNSDIDVETKSELETNTNICTNAEANEIISTNDDDNCDIINIYNNLDIEKTDEQTSTRLFIDSLCFKEELSDDEQTHILPNSYIDVEIKSELEINTNICTNAEANEIISTNDDDSNNTNLGIDKTDRDEIEDCSNNHNDSSYIHTVDDNERKTDPVSIDNVNNDPNCSLASDTDDHTNLPTIIKVVSLYDNGVPPPKKLVRNEAKPQHRIPETSGESDANNETSNNLAPLNTSQTQLKNMKQGKKQTKSAFVKCNRNKKETAKLNRIVKNKSIHNKVKKTRDSYKNIKNLNKLSVETAITEKTEINKINTALSNTTVADSMFNANSIKHIDLYKYCKVCNLKCVTKDDLAKHMRFHDNSRPHVCDVCHYRFDKLSNLNRHKSVIHKIGTTKEYICDICNYKSLQISDLTRHNRIHSGNKPFTCNICGYKFTQKSSLKKHLLKHTGEKRFSCRICSYKCARKDALKSHMRIHT